MIPAYVRRERPIQEVPANLRYNGGLPVDWDPMIPVYFIKRWGDIILRRVRERHFTMPLDQPLPWTPLFDVDVETTTYRYHVTFVFERRYGDDERIIVKYGSPADLQAIHRWTHDAREIEEGPG